MRTDPAAPNPFVPIIMLTGYTHIDRVLQARDAGASMNSSPSRFSVEDHDAAADLSVIENPRPYVRTKDA